MYMCRLPELNYKEENINEGNNICICVGCQFVIAECGREIPRNNICICVGCQIFLKVLCVCIVGNNICICVGCQKQIITKAIYSQRKQYMYMCRLPVCNPHGAPEQRKNQYMYMCRLPEWRCVWEKIYYQKQHMYMCRLPVGTVR